MWHVQSSGWHWIKSPVPDKHLIMYQYDGHQCDSLLTTQIELGLSEAEYMSWGRTGKCCVWVLKKLSLLWARYQRGFASQV